MNILAQWVDLLLGGLTHARTGMFESCWPQSSYAVSARYIVEPRRFAPGWFIFWLFTEPQGNGTAFANQSCQGVVNQHILFLGGRVFTSSGEVFNTWVILKHQGFKMKITSTHNLGLVKAPLIFSIAISVWVPLGGPLAADMLVFNSSTGSNNETTRIDWLDAIGISEPQNFVDFEEGFEDGQNIAGVPGLFPAGLVLRDTGSGTPSVIIRSGMGVIGGSNPVGTFSATHDEQPFLELDFSSAPVDYVGFLDIDHAGTTGDVTFVGGITESISLETTFISGNTAEFFGIFRNDLPPITRVRLNASGDGIWGVDHIEYGGLVLLGDVNLDGSVDLLDVAPFIDLVLGGGFQLEADINQDGDVNLLDVQPFIDLILAP